MLTSDEAATRDRIQAADDVEVQDVSEPISGTSLTRLLSQTWTSASVGSRYAESYRHLNPASSPEWGALAGIDESVEAL